MKNWNWDENYKTGKFNSPSLNFSVSWEMDCEYIEHYFKLGFTTN